MGFGDRYKKGEEDPIIVNDSAEELNDFSHKEELSDLVIDELIQSEVEFEASAVHLTAGAYESAFISASLPDPCPASKENLAKLVEDPSSSEVLPVIIARLETLNLIDKELSKAELLTHCIFVEIGLKYREKRDDAKEKTVGFKGVTSTPSEETEERKEDMPMVNWSSTEIQELLDQSNKDLENGSKKEEVIEDLIKRIKNEYTLTPEQEIEFTEYLKFRLPTVLEEQRLRKEKEKTIKFYKKHGVIDKEATIDDDIILQDIAIALNTKIQNKEITFKEFIAQYAEEVSEERADGFTEYFFSDIALKRWQYLEEQTYKKQNYKQAFKAFKAGGTELQAFIEENTEGFTYEHAAILEEIKPAAQVTVATTETSKEETEIDRDEVLTPELEAIPVLKNTINNEKNKLTQEEDGIRIELHNDPETKIKIKDNGEIVVTLDADSSKPKIVTLLNPEDIEATIDKHNAEKVIKELGLRTFFNQGTEAEENMLDFATLITQRFSSVKESPNPEDKRFLSPKDFDQYTEDLLRTIFKLSSNQPLKISEDNLKEKDMLVAGKIKNLDTFREAKHAYDLKNESPEKENA